MGYTHFDLSLRMELAILRQKGYSAREIAQQLRVHHSNVSRELKENSYKDGTYEPFYANHLAYLKRKYSKYEGMKIREEPWLEDYVKEKLKAGWTPEQISGRLKKEHGKPVISFKIIYKWIYSAFGQEYSQYLPSKRHKPRKRKKKKTKRQLIPDRIWIEERPKEADRRQRIGDFEGDTMGKPGGSHHTLVAMADRKSRFIAGRKVRRLKRSMEDGFQKMVNETNPRSLTLDNGPENVRHKKLGVPTFFCHPYRSWEKPTIENSFQRVRRWIPKKARLEDYSDEFIASIIEKMNNTPRKCLGYKTPAEVFKDQFAP